MAYDLDNLKKNRGGATLEQTDQGATPAGLYRHPETGAEIITLYDPLFGDAQSEGVVRVGFVRVGDAPEGSVKSLVEQNLEERNKKDSSYKGLAARLEKLEGVQTQNASLQAEVDALRKEKADREGREVPSGAEQKSAETAKENAADVVAERTDSDVALNESGELTGEGTAANEQPATAPLATEPNGVTSGSPATGDQGDGTPNEVEGDEEAEKPLSQQNLTELKETAAAEEVELTEEHDTKAKIKEAIEAKRAAGDSDEEGEG